MTDETDRRMLLSLARDAIVAYLSGFPPPTPAFSGVFGRRGGAFVTIHGGDGSLRGCIGHLEDDQPLGHVLARCSVSAASQDPRFAAVASSELATLRIELSLLGPLEAISDPSAIEIGRHGLVVACGRTRGLLLPQVATEWQWDAVTFLAHTCRKAGLPDEAWKSDAKVWRFEAEVFGEQSTVNS